MRIQFRLILALAAAAALPGFACKSSVATVGEFKALTSNLSDGDTWALNRPIQVLFNNEIDPTSVTFSSFVIRPLDAANPNPVTGTFELGPDADGNPNRAIIFRPVCPTNATNDNGSFRPGGFRYELSLPTQASSTTVLRDFSGKTLSVGLTRLFQTPTPPSEPLFADTVNGPMRIDAITWPKTLNLFTQEKLFIAVRFNQSFDASPNSLNLTNLFVQYANVGGTFPPTGNAVPGRWIVQTNCSDEAEVLFEITGVLIPERGLRVVMGTEFLDLGANANTSITFSDAYLAPSLLDVTSLPSFDEDDVFLDELRDGFLTAAYVDAGADLPQPPASIEPDGIRAVFSYGGTALPPEDDFTVTTAQAYLEIDTTGVSQVTDGLGRTFTCNQGVMQVNDFKIEAGATLRLRGSNPFLLYASGTVLFLGTLDASGFNAQVPDGGHFHPELAVPGALGVLGGGRGGTSSQITDDFTPRGESGQGPFGTGTGLGGQGGEGAIQQSNGLALDDIEFFLAGGGGGGGFSPGRTDAVMWTKWVGTQVPVDFDNVGPDLRADRHTVFNGAVNEDTLFLGAEAGLRGTNKDGIITPNPGPLANNPHAAYGMEDISQDSDAGIGADADDLWDPAWTAGLTPPFLFGNPTFGPDGGAGGASVFSDTNAANNFFGNRYFWDGTAGVAPVLVTGELMAPWAGAGGGASGDVQTVERLDLTVPPDGNLEPLPMFFPDLLFPYGSTRHYWRGAPGGGGGGQVQIHAVGVIGFGPAGRVKAIGGSGNSGESTDESGSNGTISQISGSGGGSGGHVILQSATGLDLSAINVGTAGNPNIPGTFFNNLVAADIIQAVGGRRGWAGSKLNIPLAGAPGTRDGNSTYMVGRGGAGASGVIQIHVPDPVNDITFAAAVDAQFKAYMRAVNVANPVISDRLDALLGLYGEPQPFGLVPFFSPRTMAQSIWIDTGLASLRNPVNGVGPFPDYAHAVGGFEGVNALTGIVDQTGDEVTPGAVIASDGGAGSATIAAYEVTVAAAAASFAELHLSNPALLIGFDFSPNVAQAKVFEIVAAAYDAVADRMTLTTRVADGAMSALASANWAVREKYFRLDTSEVKDRLPANTDVCFQFQGADAIAGTNTLNPATITPWTGDGVTTLTTLQGKRFIRWRLTFDLDSGSTGAVLEAEIPVLDYLKLPFAW
jgi:hypothetical protein